jgi:hypothetical protein
MIFIGLIYFIATLIALYLSVTKTLDIFQVTIFIFLEIIIGLLFAILKVLKDRAII